MEKNVKVKGGKMKNNIWSGNNVMHDAELQGWKADLALRKYSFESVERQGRF